MVPADWLAIGHPEGIPALSVVDVDLVLLFVVAFHAALPVGAPLNDLAHAVAFELGEDLLGAAVGYSVSGCAALAEGQSPLPERASWEVAGTGCSSCL